MFVRKTRAGCRSAAELLVDQPQHPLCDEHRSRVEDVLARRAKMDEPGMLFTDPGANRAHERLYRIAGGPSRTVRESITGEEHATYVVNRDKSSDQLLVDILPRP